MPILEPTSVADPLGQGDLLKGIALYRTTVESPGGGIPIPTVSDPVDSYALVLSRACVLAHKSEIVVAHVEHYRGDGPDLKSLESAEEFLRQLRDGTGTPDRFYLAQIPGGDERRFTAHLDSLHTIVLPAADQRDRFIAAHRVARLNIDFARALHVRLFEAFSHFGFDDDEWYSTGDLQLLVHAAEAQKAELDVKLKNSIANLKAHEFSGATDQKKSEGLQREVERHMANVQALERRIASLRSRIDSRSRPQPEP